MNGGRPIRDTTIPIEQAYLGTALHGPLVAEAEPLFELHWDPQTVVLSLRERNKAQGSWGFNPRKSLTRIEVSRFPSLIADAVTHYLRSFQGMTM